MSSEYYDSELTAEQIEQALNAIHGVIAPANNGKVLAVENGVIVAKSVSEWGQGGYPEPTGTIQISSNGTVNVKDYASAEVNVPSGITAADEGKVVKNGALVAQTARATEITANGTYDTTENNSVTVNVSGGLVVVKIMEQGQVSTTSSYATAYYDSGIDPTQYIALMVNLWKLGSKIGTGIFVPVGTDQRILGSDDYNYRFETTASSIRCTQYSGTYYNLYVDVYGIVIPDAV